MGEVEIKRRACLKCGQQVAIAEHSNVLIMHECHHGHRCSIFALACEACKTNKARPGTVALPPRDDR